MHSTPILYSFRRCPYAIRARLALAYAGITVELREVVLRDKPGEMLRLSPKGTVPVLQVCDQLVLEESLQIMNWALEQHDPQGWAASEPALTQSLIAQNDGPFKYALDRYKYFSGHPEKSQAQWRDDAVPILRILEAHLAQNAGGGLVGSTPSLADFALFPFVRQFRGVDIQWFDAVDLPWLQAWFDHLQASALFARVMTKRVAWQPQHTPVLERWE